jgi:hypothetical protein
MNQSELYRPNEQTIPYALFLTLPFAAAAMYTAPLLCCTAEGGSRLPVAAAVAVAIALPPPNSGAPK